MHWPYPPNPAEYQSPGPGVVVGMFAIALILCWWCFMQHKPTHPYFRPSQSWTKQGLKKEKAINSRVTLFREQSCCRVLIAAAFPSL
jgi:hypothetical protein